jgi:predicted porin
MRFGGAPDGAGDRKEDEMRGLRSILLAGGAFFALASVAQAADLPTKKAAPVPEKPNCFATFWSWLDSTPADCPLSYWGVTFYGQVDLGVGYSTHAARFNNAFPQGVQELVSRQSQKGAWQGVPNGLARSAIGLKWKEQISGDWYFIGDVNAGFDPYSLQFVNGPRSLSQNNNVLQINQNANGDSNRAYGPINGRAYAGVQNKTFGTLTYGRQAAFSNDLVESVYDPYSGAYAFSLIGNSATFGGGLGVTELARYTNSFKYAYADHGVRVGAMGNAGGWGAGNNSRFGYEVTAGFDFNGFSVDGVYKYARDAVSLATYSVLAPPFGAGVLKATIQNVSSFQIGTKYKWDRVTLFGGYEHQRLTDPSDLSAGAALRAFNGGYSAAFGVGVQGLGAAGAFPAPKIVQVLWAGAKFAVLPNVDLIGAYYHVWQNDYVGPTEVFAGPARTCRANTTVIPGAAAAGFTPQGANSSKCSGTEDAVSGAIDWRPYKRLDVYAGAMYSQVGGGLANGFFVNNNLAVTGGVRLGF